MCVRERIEAIREAFIDNILKMLLNIRKKKTIFTAKLDKILMNKYLGIPIFLGIIWLIFQTTFTWVGTPLSDKMDDFIGGQLTD